MAMPPKHLELACGTPVLVIGGIWTTMLQVGCIMYTPEPGVGLSCPQPDPVHLARWGCAS